MSKPDSQDEVSAADPPSEETADVQNQNTSKVIEEKDNDEVKNGKMEKNHISTDDVPQRKRRKMEYVRPEPTPDRCQFFVERKRRYCKAPPRKDKIYCVEHSHELNDPSIRKRIPCPLDPKHTVYEDCLQKHLKKCNSRPDLRPAFYEEGINGGDAEGFDTTTKVSVRTVSEEEIVELVEKVKLLYAEHIKSLREEKAFHPVLKSMAEDPVNGHVAQKHIQQQASLVANLQRLGLLATNHCYVEFGAGKGGLSHWVQLSIKDKPDTQFILIDKSACRYKMDSYHRSTDQGPSFDRVKIDIQHLNLEKMPQVAECDKPIVSIGKHLCGGATDLMLRCVTETLHVHKRTAGILNAVCCHHRCDWKSYVGKEFISQQCGLSPHQFLLLCSMTSWATCSSPHVSENQTDKPEAEGDGEASTYNHHRYGHLLPQEREKIGYWCKNLIDYGRVCYLRKHGFDTDLVAYVDKSYTIENTALMAKLAKDS